MIEKYAIRYCEVSSVEVEGPVSLPDKIRKIVINYRDGIPNKGQVAKELNISLRTLARGLESENTSYRKVVDNLRKDIAISYLQKSNWSVDDVADMLGYGSSANFGRAFKQWTGQTPSHFRNEAQASKPICMSLSLETGVI